MIPIDGLLAGAEAHRRETGRPRVTLSYAQSLDGSLSDRRGRPFGLSGPASLQLTHRLRAAHDAILVGIGTILADNPRLTARLVEGGQPQPVVLDSQLRFPMEAVLLNGPRRPWISASDRASHQRQADLEAAGALVLRFPQDDQGRIPLPALLERLAGLGINSLMVEGGGEVISAFLSQQLIDLAVLTITPVFIGGYHLLGPWANSLHSPTPHYPRIKDPAYQNLGEDLIVWGKFA